MHETHAALLRAVDPAALGARVRSARESRALTQTQLAGSAFSAGYVSRIESGARRPTLKALTDLARRLDTPVDQLLRGVSATEYDEIRLGLDYAELALESGEATEAEDQARNALMRAELASVSEFTARGHYLLGRALEALGRIDDAVPELEHVARADHGLLTVRSGIALTRCHRVVGDLTLSIETGERMQAMLPRLGLTQTDEAVQLAATVAAAWYERGDLHQASRLCTQALRTAEALASPRAKAAAYWEASVVQAKLGHAHDAVPLAERALALMGEDNDARNLARLHLQVGQTMLSADPANAPEALQHIRRGRHDLPGTSASADEIAAADVELARALLVSGDPAAAAEAAMKAVQRPGDRQPIIRAEAFVIQGRAEHAQGRAEAAGAAYQQAVELLARLDADHETAQAWCDLADALEDLGDLDTARMAFRRATGAMGLSPRRAGLPTTSYTRA